MVEEWKKNYANNLSKGYFSSERTNPVMFLVNNLFYTKVPFILIGAGPSLEDNISLVKDYVNNAVIICVDIVLQRLLKEGIAPDFVVNIDPSEVIHKYWCEDIPKSVKLVCSTATNPKTIEKWPGHIFLFNQIDLKGTAKGKALSDLVQPTARFGNLPNRFFVGATALQVASLFNPSFTILVGYDFAYKNNKAYCNDILEYRIEKSDPDYATKLIELEKRAYNNEITYEEHETSNLLVMYSDVFFREVARLRLRVANSTEGGILDINNIALKMSLKKLCSKKITKYDTSKIKKRKRRKNK